MLGKTNLKKANFDRLIQEGKVGDLVRGLKHREPIIRQLAVGSLANAIRTYGNGIPRLIGGALLARAGSNPEKKRQIQVDAMNLVRWIVNPDVFAGLVGALRDDDPANRRTAAKALGLLGGARIMIRLMMRGEGPGTRPVVETFPLLGQLSREVDVGLEVEPLVSTLDDPDAGVRAHAAEALSHLQAFIRSEENGPTVIERVSALASGDPDEGVRQAAQKALGFLTKE